MRETMQRWTDLAYLWTFSTLLDWAVSLIGVIRGERPTNGGDGC